MTPPGGREKSARPRLPFTGHAPQHSRVCILRADFVVQKGQVRHDPT
jgi:hypothetical protein